jgi:hypothetical protein
MGDFKKIGEIETDTTKKVKAWELNVTQDGQVCPDCKSTKFNYQIKIIPTARKEEWYPKYVPQIKRACASCGKYIRFEKQTEELISRFNGRFQSIVIPAQEEGVRNYENELHTNTK